MTPLPAAPESARGVRPLDRFASFKVKLGVLVAITVTLAAGLAWLGLRSGLPPLVTIPAIVLIALVVTQILARGMTSPLRQMTQAARAMARGDYGQRITASSRDEVGQLAQAFTSMAAELEQTDRMRRDLVANVSHELRTPVAALRGQLENLVDGVTPPDPESLQVALAATERLSRLVDHLLDLSRLDAGVAELRVERIELTPFLHEAVDAAALAARGRGRDVRWVVDVQPADLTVIADADRIQQVITNLLDNASRHSPPGGRIRLGARRRADPAAVVLEVRDEGPGIPRAERERVFERFERGGRADASGGTGLGLAIARWAVTLHGGSIEVVDDPVTGSLSAAPPDRLPGRGPEGADAGERSETSSLIRVTLPDRGDRAPSPSTGARG